SIPCLEEFATCDAAAREGLLPPGVPRLFVEAGPGATWSRWMADGDAFHGIDRFGASAPGATVADGLGLNVTAVAASARVLLG
ncbi:transketolase, partial [bacterium]|nr:transketolase [bacterium]